MLRPPAVGESVLWDRMAALPEIEIATSGAPSVGEVREAAERLAAALSRLELGSGARIAAALPNGPMFLTAFLACRRAGMTFVPLNPALPLAQRDALQDSVGVGALLTPEGVTLRTSAPAFSPGPAVILFTSGSSGDSKAVALPESALLHVADSHAAALRLERGTSVLGYLPWSHAFGFTLELLMGVLHGQRVRTVSGDGFAEAFSQRPPDWLFSVPRMLERLPPDALAVLQGGIVGGAPVHGKLRQRLCGTKLRVGYGQTECGPGATLGEAGQWELDDFLGHPVGCELQLRSAPGEEDAELFVRGPNLGMGYADREGVRAFALEAEGWKGTGDLATGSGPGSASGFSFLGRRDSLLKLDNGRMVNPVPLERPFEGALLLIGSGQSALQPLARGRLPDLLSLPVPHLPPRLMPEEFWLACTTPSGKISRRRAEQLFLP